jgi:hypothetical protein
MSVAMWLMGFRVEPRESGVMCMLFGSSAIHAQSTTIFYLARGPVRVHGTRYEGNAGLIGKYGRKNHSTGRRESDRFHLRKPLNNQMTSKRATE